MVLGASNYTYSEATFTQKLPDFVGATIRGFEDFGGVPEVIVPDQLRSAVRGPDRYEPDINATYLDMAQHYGVSVVPARPRKPKDKAKVEGAVLIVQRWVLARIRRCTFFSLDELNQAILGVDGRAERATLSEAGRLSPLGVRDVGFPRAAPTTEGAIRIRRAPRPHREHRLPR